jgi:hypothetical protein
MEIKDMTTEQLMKYYGDLLFEINKKMQIKREFEKEIEERSSGRNENE